MKDITIFFGFVAILSAAFFLNAIATAVAAFWSVGSITLWQFANLFFTYYLQDFIWGLLKVAYKEYEKEIKDEDNNNEND